MLPDPGSLLPLPGFRTLGKNPLIFVPDQLQVFELVFPQCAIDAVLLRSISVAIRDKTFSPCDGALARPFNCIEGSVTVDLYILRDGLVRKRLVTPEIAEETYRRQVPRGFLSGVLAVSEEIETVYYYGIGVVVEVRCLNDDKAASVLHGEVCHHNPDLAGVTLPAVKFGLESKVAIRYVERVLICAEVGLVEQ